eukprot:Hpha_TRINITY_DN18772_c0_g1::TRINITY_DN18772_c0_g1_i1::g.47442::m.47442
MCASFIFLVAVLAESGGSDGGVQSEVGNKTGTCCFLCEEGCTDCAGCWSADYYCSKDRSSCLSLCRGRWCDAQSSTLPFPSPAQTPVLPGAVASLKQSRPTAIGNNVTQVVGPVVGDEWVVWGVLWNETLVLHGTSLADYSEWEVEVPGLAVKALVEPQLTTGFFHVQVGAERPLPTWGNATCYANPYDYPGTLQSLVISADIRTGELQWSCRLGLYGTVSFLTTSRDPGSSSEGVFYSTSNAKVFGVASADGQGLWGSAPDTVSHPYSSRPSLAFGALLQVGSNRGAKTLYAYEAHSGQFLWQIPFMGSPNWQIPVVSGQGYGFRSATFFNRYEMGEPDGRIEAYQGGTGSAWIGPRWELNVAEVLGKPQSSEGLLYMTSCADYPDQTAPSQTFREKWVNCSVWAIDATDASAGPVRRGVLWKYSLPPGRAVSDPVARTGVVFVATTIHNGTGFAESFLVALDAAYGDLLWERAFPSSSAISGPNIAASMPLTLAPWGQFDVSSDGTRLCHMGSGGVVTFLDVSARVYSHPDDTQWYQRPGVIAVAALGTVVGSIAVAVMHRSVTGETEETQPLLHNGEAAGSDPSSEGRPNT